MNKQINTNANSAKVFVTCYNDKRNNGGLYKIEDEHLNPIFEGTNCHGLEYYENQKILFCATRTTPQIRCFKINSDQSIQNVKTIFEDYIFGEDAHGICILDNKIYLAATAGDPNTENATNTDGPGTKVGKIIVSDFKVEENKIKISNSKIINPFDCSHHHHVNEICYNGKEMFVTSFSYCDTNKNYIKNGAVSKLTFDGKTVVLIDDFEKPHSLSFFKNKFYLVSSSTSKIFSIDPHTKKKTLEYKCSDVFVKGLLVTDEYFYLGLNSGIGRTDWKSTVPTTGILKINRKTSETKKISLPPQSNNVYSIKLVKI